jgi:hypothetical protein
MPPKRQAGTVRLRPNGSKHIRASSLHDNKDREIERLKAELAQSQAENATLQDENATLRVEKVGLHLEKAFWLGTALTHNNPGATQNGFYQLFKSLPNEVFVRTL